MAGFGEGEPDGRARVGKKGPRPGRIAWLIVTGSCGVADHDGDEERQREHAQGDVPMPGGPAADLVVVEADLALAGLEGFLDRPAGGGHPDQGPQWVSGR